MFVKLMSHRRDRHRPRQMTRRVGVTGATPGWRREAQRALRTAAAVAWVAVAAAQAPTITAVKAAFLYNFANFAEWPADSLSPGQRLSLCVIGDNGIADALNQTIKGHTVKGHELTVAVLKADGSLRACHLLYASGLDMNRIAQLMQALKGASVLTVSDSDKFAESGGIAQLILENDRMHFAINAAAADRARIRLSSKLLNLARMVKDESDVQR
jgi:hypothetical protein